MLVKLKNIGSTTVDFSISQDDIEPEEYVTLEANSSVETSTPHNTVKLFVKNSEDKIFFKGYIPAGSEKPIIINANSNRVNYNDHSLPNDLEGFNCYCEETNYYTYGVAIGLIILLILIAVATYYLLK